MLRSMQQNKTAIERAFELARSGRVRTVSEIRATLKAEGYDQRHLEGRALVKQLQDILRARQAAAPDQPGE